MRNLLFVISILSMTVMSFSVEWETKYKWKYVDFDWDEKQRTKMEKTDKYKADKIFLFDVAKARDGTIFVTALKRKGVPCSLMTVTEKNGEGGPLLHPYPDWSWHKNKNCKGIVGSVYRMQIEDKYLFLLDDGRVGKEKRCSPKIVIFDLSTNKPFKIIPIPSKFTNNANGNGWLRTLTVYNPSYRINDAIVFMGDVIGHGLVIYTMRDSKFCRIQSETMKPTYLNSTEGIFDLTIFDEGLYYTSCMGNRMYKLDISKLEGCPATDTQADSLIELVGMLPGPTESITAMQCGVFFSNVHEKSIMCLDSWKGIKSENMDIVTNDVKGVQYTSGMKHDCYDILMLTNSYDGSQLTVDTKETNFRIHLANMATIRKENEKCFNSCTF